MHWRVCRVRSHDLSRAAAMDVRLLVASQLFHSIPSQTHTPSFPLLTYTHYTHGRNIRPKSSAESRRGAVKLSPSFFTSLNHVPFLPLPPARPPAPQIEKQCVVLHMSAIEATDGCSFRRLSGLR